MVGCYAARQVRDTMAGQFQPGLPAGEAQPATGAQAMTPDPLAVNSKPLAKTLCADVGSAGIEVRMAPVAAFSRTTASAVFVKSYVPTASTPAPSSVGVPNAPLGRVSAR